MKQLTITDKGYAYLQSLLAGLTILSATQLPAAVLTTVDELEIMWSGTDTSSVQVTLPASISTTTDTITVTLPTDVYNLISHQAINEITSDTAAIAFN